ncbi:MAG: beta-hydroxyacyl-ACP dehydratase [Deltaproteobacteria bacterium HGW-Deltaproteobacteria-12]|jgi:3-hydroxyacyl-[acyl-carrier-protein] dehydratase|nr:MAG: beta-hydroxyacyl-ACP dehydratase [Deltaproteobacteria bacterium HGW-Deltaproteobacteria-12]
MEADAGIVREVLALVPQQEPFRFIDEIISLNEEGIVGAYRFRNDAFFYRGHFPGRPITPGVILMETMAQIGVVAFGMYLLACQKNVRPGRMQGPLSLFSLADDVEFKGIVLPGERVIVTGNKIYFRKGALKVGLTMQRENGEVVCLGKLAGMGVSK